MITLTAKINLLSGDNSALTLGANDLSGNNISSKLSDIVGVKKQGSNPFIIGASKLGDGSTFSNGVDYFIDDQLSDENGNFLTPYEITINGKKLNSLTIAFDTANKRHPKQITLLKKLVTETTTTENLIAEAKKGVIHPEGIYYEAENNLFKAMFAFDAKNFPQKNLNLEFIGIFDTPEGPLEIVLRYLGEGLLYYDGSYIILDFTFDQNVFSYYDENIILFNGLPCDLTTATYSVVISGISETTTTKTELIKIGDFIDNDPIFTISGLIETDNIIIKIEDWNVPNYPLVITGIYAEVNIDIDYRNLISISRSIFDRSDLKLPSWGIISNTGNIEFNDTDGEIRDYAEQLLLQSGLSCEIKINNTLVDGASETIGLFETDQWDYDNDNRVVSVSIKDDLEEWQDINVAEISYDPRKTKSKPFSWLYEHLWGITNPNYPMLKLDDLDSATQDILRNTYIQYPLLESGSLWQQWTKLCQVCQLHIYKNNDGVVVCRYNGGN